MSSRDQLTQEVNFGIFCIHFLFCLLHVDGFNPHIAISGIFIKFMFLFYYFLVFFFNFVNAKSANFSNGKCTFRMSFRQIKLSPVLI